MADCSVTVGWESTYGELVGRIWLTNIRMTASSGGPNGGNNAIEVSSLAVPNGRCRPVLAHGLAALIPSHTRAEFDGRSTARERSHSNSTLSALRGAPSPRTATSARRDNTTLPALDVPASTQLDGH